MSVGGLHPAHPGLPGPLWDDAPPSSTIESLIQEREEIERGLECRSANQEASSGKAVAHAALHHSGRCRFHLQDWPFRQLLTAKAPAVPECGRKQIHAVSHLLEPVEPAGKSRSDRSDWQPRRETAKSVSETGLVGRRGELDHCVGWFSVGRARSWASSLGGTGTLSSRSRASTSARCWAFWLAT